MASHSNFVPGKNRELKEAAKSAFGAALMRGAVEREGQCEDCGGAAKEGHHEDYAFPLAVAWLCRKCHKKRHYPEAPVNTKTATLQFQCDKEWRRKVASIAKFRGETLEAICVDALSLYFNISKESANAQ